MRLIKKLILPALLFFPSQLSGYFSEVKLNNEMHRVDINEDRKIIQLNAENEKVIKLSSVALINHQKRLLEIGLHELDYEIYGMAKSTILKSKDLSSRIKSIGNLFGAGIKFPWQAIALMNSNSKVYALREVIPNRKIAREYLDSLGEIESEDYNKLNDAYNYLKELNQIVSSSSRLIKDTVDASEIKFVITPGEISNLKKDIHYLNGKSIEKLWKTVEERFRQSKDYSKYSKDIKIKKSENLEDYLKRFFFVNEPLKELIAKNYKIPLETTSQYDSKLNSEIDIEIKKSLRKNDGYNLDLMVSIKDYKKEKGFENTFVLNKSKSSVFMFSPPGCETSSSEQSIYSMKALDGKMHGSFEEIFPKGEDKLITAKLNAAEYLVNKALKKIFPGNYTRATNVLGWIMSHIINYENNKKEVQKKSLLERLSEDYSVKEIQLYPSDSQTPAYSISIPVEKQEDPIYVMLNIGIQDWQQKSTGKIEGLIFEIKNDVATEKLEEIVIPPLWIERINSSCKGSPPSNENGYAKFLRSLKNDSPSGLSKIVGDLAEKIIAQNKMEDDNKIGRDKYLWCPSKGVVLKEMNSEILKIRRKNYGWILSEPFVKKKEDGTLDVLTSFSDKLYKNINPKDNVPNKVTNAFLKDVVDEELIDIIKTEKIGNGHCILALLNSGHQYYCYFPTTFDENDYHLEFTGSLNKLNSSLGISPLEKIYLSTRMSFEDGKLKI
ncbi:MAG: hypothetical protein KKE23_02865, partial [Nanoarchaeota archaeon]|nr:hypothetical protein [Nanoarchaeota archaeon]